MKKLLNVLYLLTSESYLYRQNETIAVKVGGEDKVRIPSHTIESIICMGNSTISTPFIGFCGEKGISLSFVSDYGRFLGRITGPVHGNVLLRKKQFESLSDKQFCSEIVKYILTGKIANSKNMLLRSAREHNDEGQAQTLVKAAEKLSNIALKLRQDDDVALLRGYEGIAANMYYDVFDLMIKVNKDDFYFRGRNRRPPTDNMNAVLSFLYMLLKNDVQSALESLGLDPAAGFLHTLRPGRPSLALDMMEELRAPLCDRLALSLINLKQLQGKDFEETSEGVLMSDKAKKTVISAWQERKKEEIAHPFLNEKISIGLIPFAQSQLLAKVLRGDLDVYPPFIWR